MALIKATLQQRLYSGLSKIFVAQSNKATSGDENEDPNEVIKQIADDMASVISDAIDEYIKSGDIVVGPNNIQVTSSAPGTPAVVAPLQPAKLK